MNRIIVFIHLVIISLFIGCTPKQKDSKIQANEIFSNISAYEYSFETLDSDPSNKIFKINGRKVSKLNWKEINSFDNILFNLPSDYFLDRDESNLKIYENEIGDDFIFQILNDESYDSFELINEIINHAKISGFKVTLNSAKYFETKENDFLVYDIELLKNGKFDSAIGILFRFAEFKYLDFSLKRKKKNTDFERILFYEIIKSIRINNEFILPANNHIKKQLQIEIE